MGSLGITGVICDCLEHSVLCANQARSRRDIRHPQYDHRLVVLTRLDFPLRDRKQVTFVLARTIRNSHFIFRHYLAGDFEYGPKKIAAAGPTVSSRRLRTRIVVVDQLGGEA